MYLFIKKFTLVLKIVKGTKMCLFILKIVYVKKIVKMSKDVYFLYMNVKGRNFLS